MRGRTVHRCSVVVVFISRTQTPPTLRRTTWRVCWWGPRSGYLVTRLIIEPKVVYGIQAALSAASSDLLAAGPAFCLRSKLRNVHLLVSGDSSKEQWILARTFIVLVSSQSHAFRFSATPRKMPRVLFIAGKPSCEWSYAQQVLPKTRAIPRRGGLWYNR